MISVSDARRRILNLVTPLGAETVALPQAAGRVLAEAAVAQRTQPPFSASAMDGYAVRSTEAERGATLSVTREIAAGASPGDQLAVGEAARIFTGAPLPEDADAILLQEDAVRDGDKVTVGETAEAGQWVRPAGLDFTAGAPLISAPTRLTARDVALAAAMGLPWLTMARRPRVALVAIGDELQLPGMALGTADIVSSNNFGIAALCQEWGAEPVQHPVLKDDIEALRSAIRTAGADVIVTLGGASEGDHDLSRPAFQAEGMTPDFYKIAMRPGKPLMAGKLGDTLVLGLPGNPVSAMVCAVLFLRPALDRLQGLDGAPPTTRRARLAISLPSNGPREHYMRSTLAEENGELWLTPFESQDSSRLALLSKAQALAIRPPSDSARARGDVLDCIVL